jgi:hypothetical protein
MNIMDDLAARVKRVNQAWATVSNQAEASDERIGDIALWWAAALEGYASFDSTRELFDPETAARLLLEQAVPEAEAATSEFWGTALGRALARCGAAPINDVTERVGAAVLGEILGVTRQRAFDLQKAGRMCTPKQVADELKRRDLEATGG